MSQCAQAWLCHTKNMELHIHIHPCEAAVVLLVTQSPMNCRVSGLTPGSSWSYVSLDKTLNPELFCSQQRRPDN